VSKPPLEASFVTRRNAHRSFRSEPRSFPALLSTPTLAIPTSWRRWLAAWSSLKAFTPQTPQMTISQLSLRTGLSRAAVRRCLYTLVKLGFAGTDESQRYSLRPKMLTLANTYTASSTLANAAQPILERMSAIYGESFSVATLDGDNIVYIARTTVTRVMSVDLHIGSRLPAFCTSMGRVLLGLSPPGSTRSLPLPRYPHAIHRTHHQFGRQTPPLPAQRPPQRLCPLRSGV